MRIGKLFGALDPAIEHIGSTAVRGMSAKPIIDILIGFGNEQQRDDCEKVLAHHGYHYRPRFESVVAERRFFESDQAHWPANSLRFHLHVVNRGCQFWEDRIRFRDMLRRNQSVAGAYSRLKTQLSRKHTNDRRAYSNAKGGFVTSALQINQHESHDNAYQHSKFDEDTGISPLRRVQAKQKCRN